MPFRSRGRSRYIDDDEDDLVENDLNFVEDIVRRLDREDSTESDERSRSSYYSQSSMGGNSVTTDVLYGNLCRNVRDYQEMDDDEDHNSILNVIRDLVSPPSSPDDSQDSPIRDRRYNFDEAELLRNLNRSLARNTPSREPSRRMPSSTRSHRSRRNYSSGRSLANTRNTRQTMETVLKTLIKKRLKAKRSQNTESMHDVQELESRVNELTRLIQIEQNTSAQLNEIEKTLAERRLKHMAVSQREALMKRVNKLENQLDEERTLREDKLYELNEFIMRLPDDDDDDDYVEGTVTSSLKTRPSTFMQPQHYFEGMPGGNINRASAASPRRPMVPAYNSRENNSSNSTVTKLGFAYKDRSYLEDSDKFSSYPDNNSSRMLSHATSDPISFRPRFENEDGTVSDNIFRDEDSIRFQPRKSYENQPGILRNSLSGRSLSKEAIERARSPSNRIQHSLSAPTGQVETDAEMIALSAIRGLKSGNSLEDVKENISNILLCYQNDTDKENTMNPKNDISSMDSGSIDSELGTKLANMSVAAASTVIETGGDDQTAQAAAAAVMKAGYRKSKSNSNFNALVSQVAAKASMAVLSNGGTQESAAAVSVAIMRSSALNHSGELMSELNRQSKHYRNVSSGRPPRPTGYSSSAPIRTFQIPTKQYGDLGIQSSDSSIEVSLPDFVRNSNSRKRRTGTNNNDIYLNAGALEAFTDTKAQTQNRSKKRQGTTKSHHSSKHYQSESESFSDIESDMSSESEAEIVSKKKKTKASRSSSKNRKNRKKKKKQPVYESESSDSETDDSGSYSDSHSRRKKKGLKGSLRESLSPIKKLKNHRLVLSPKRLLSPKRKTSQDVEFFDDITSEEAITKPRKTLRKHHQAVRRTDHHPRVSHKKKSVSSVIGNTFKRLTRKRTAI